MIDHAHHIEAQPDHGARFERMWREFNSRNAPDPTRHLAGVVAAFACLTLTIAAFKLIGMGWEAIHITSFLAAK